MDRRQLLQAAGGTILAASSVTSAVAAQSNEYEPLGSVAVTGATEAVVHDAGQTACVATQHGFAIVDISTPESPTLVETRTELLDDRENGPLREVLNVAVEGDRLLVAGPANHQDRPSAEGFLLYDLSEPQDPERIAVHETDHPIHNATLTDEYAYLVDSTRVVVVDITGTPQEVGDWRPRDADPAWADVHRLLRFAHDLFVHEDRAYVVEWDAGTFVLDVSDPSDPEALSRIGGRSPEKLASIPESDVLIRSFVTLYRRG
jgi:hypothetical protein